MPLRLLPAAVLALSFVAPALAADDYSTFVPSADAPLETMTEAPPADALVERMFALTFSEACSWALGGSPDTRKPEIYDLKFQFGPEEPEQPMKLYRFPCSQGAYNEQHVYMAWDAYDGLRPLTFAQPTFVADHETEGNSDTPVVAMRTTGYESVTVLVNSSFDPATATISSHSCWRGICDASSTGKWVQDTNHFRLAKFEVDASYDGEQTPWLLHDEYPIDVANPAGEADKTYRTIVTAGDTPPETGLVNEIFADSFAETCAWALDGNMGAVQPNIVDLPYRDDYQEASEPDRLFRVYEYSCDAGAYNFVNVYMAWDQVSGVHLLTFSEPDMDIEYGDAEGDAEPPLKSIAVIGFTASPTLVNAEITDTGTISSFAKWRGMGDASSQAVYVQKGPTFVLKTYDVDPTYDGEYNSFRVVDYTRAQPGELVPVPEYVENSITNN